MIGIIGGSGLYNLPLENTQVFSRFDYQRYGKSSALPRIGSLNGVEVCFMPRFGVDHSIHPHRVNYEANLFAMKVAGVDAVISTGAVGSLSDEIRPGDLVIPNQFVNKSSRVTSLYKKEGQPVVHVSMGEPTDGYLDELLCKAASAFRVHLGPRVGPSDINYVCIDGPQFSTRADSSYNRMAYEHSVVGMTAMHEAKIARELGMSFSYIGLVTDYDSYSDTPVSIDAMKAQMGVSLGNLEQVLTNLIRHPNLEVVIDMRPSFIKDSMLNACMTRNCVLDEHRIWTRSQH